MKTLLLQKWKPTYCLKKMSYGIIIPPILRYDLLDECCAAFFSRYLLIVFVGTHGTVLQQCSDYSEIHVGLFWVTFTIEGCVEYLISLWLFTKHCFYCFVIFFNTLYR